MRPTRPLALRREALAELTAAEAARVAGALSGPSCVGVCMTGVEQCLTRQWCPTLHACDSEVVCA